MIAVHGNSTWSWCMRGSTGVSSARAVAGLSCGATMIMVSLVRLDTMGKCYGTSIHG